MKKVSFTQLLIVFCFVALFSCGTKDDPGCSTAWTTELQNEVSALSAAASAYAQDQSSANCTSYKNAYKAYLDGLNSFSSCSLITGQMKIALDAAIKDAQDELATLC